jgi:serine/threonine protein kinase
VLLYGLYNDGEDLFVVMEYLPLGSAHTYLEQNSKQIDTSDLIWMCLHISRGMSYLHSKDILHNDLASRNVLLTKNEKENDGKYLAKVSDFGLSFFSNATQDYIYGDNSSQIPGSVFEIC